MTTTTNGNNFNDLAESPTFRQLAEQALEHDKRDRAAARAKALADKQEAEHYNEDERLALVEAQKHTTERVAELQADLTTAREHANQLAAKLRRIHLERTARIEAAMQVLRKTVDPEWSRFLRTLDRMADETRAAVRVRDVPSRISSLFTGSRRGEQETNDAAVGARLRAIAEVRTEVETIKAAFDGDVAGKIRELRKQIPHERTLQEYTPTVESTFRRAALAAQR